MADFNLCLVIFYTWNGSIICTPHPHPHRHIACNFLSCWKTYKYLLLASTWCLAMWLAWASGMWAGGIISLTEQKLQQPLICFPFASHYLQQNDLPQWLRHRRYRFNSWVWKIPWRSKWQPTPVFLPEKSPGQRSLVGNRPWGHKKLDSTEWLSTIYSKNGMSCPESRTHAGWTAEWRGHVQPSCKQI